MKTKRIALLFLFVWQIGFLPGQFLQIHHIGVGRGDCSLIIGNDGKNMRTLLIDAGEKSLGGNLVFPYVLKALEAVNYPRIDFIVTSHIHADHNSGFPSFFDALINYNKDHQQATITVGAIIDRTVEVGTFYPQAPDSLLSEDCYSKDVQNPVLKSSEKFGQFFTKYQNIVRSNTGNNNGFSSGQPTVYSNVALKTNLFSALSNISVTCLTGNGAVADSPDNRQIAVSGKAKENDLSFSFLIKYNSFNYFTGGDLGGAVHGGSGTNMETPLVNSVFFRDLIAPQTNVCAFKVSHHGSQGSTNPDFLNVMKPSIAVIMANFRRYNGTPLPTAEIIDKLFEAGLNPEKDIFVTFNTNILPIISSLTWGNQSSDVNFLQDIIMLVSDKDNPPPPEEAEFDIQINLKEKTNPYNLIDSEIFHCDCFQP